MNELAVVIVAFHGAEKLAASLAALGPAVRVVVVDNSSDVAVAEVVREHGRQYIDAGANLGFAAGVNLGIAYSPAKADILLLNPDAVLTAEGLHALQAALHAPGNDRTAAVTPVLIDPVTGAEQQTRWPFPTPGRMWREAVGLSRLGRRHPMFCVGAVLLLRREAIDEVGPFDERFFLYAEETDWQRRAVAVGWSTRDVRAVTATHEGAGTSTDLTRREVLFHAGTETYIRKWFGRSGWASYRLAATLGALLRAAVLPGERRHAARSRAVLYFRGPSKIAALTRRHARAGLRIVHVVVTDAFAGVERYVCEVAREQAARGSVVTVVGGDPARMQKELGAVHHRPGASLPAAIHQFARLGPQDIVHAHMTAAEFAAVLAAAWHNAPIVATRHFAGPRGSTTVGRLLGKLARRRIAAQVAISSFVAGEIGEPAVVIANGVRAQPEVSAPRHRVVLTLQRLEAEKATDVALRAWAESGLADKGWELHLAGAGTQRIPLEQLAEDLGIAGSILWLGHVADTDERLRRAALLLATASAEPFGLSVAEAMASGTPVLASDGGAHPELLGSKAWLFPAGDVQRAAQQLVDFCDLTTEERTTYGAALRERQRTLFELSSHSEQLDDLYRLVTAPARSSVTRPSHS